MKSVRTIYKMGMGPSSSHTMGPAFAAKTFKDTHPEADRFEVILYGSLAKTGKGHGTDRAITDTLAPIPAKMWLPMICGLPSLMNWQPSDKRKRVILPISRCGSSSLPVWWVDWWPCSLLVCGPLSL